MLAFFDRVHAILHEAEHKNAETIERCAHDVADSLASGGILHTFGTGHGHMLAEEIFYRAGCLVPVNAILDPTLMLHESALSSSRAERLAGYAEVVLSRYQVEPGEVIIIASNSGRNAVPIEMALTAKNRGLKVVAITSLMHAESQPSRHASGKRLHELADYVFDNCGIVGDAALSVAGVSENIGPTSTIVGAALLHALLAATIEKLVERDIDPPIFRSANVGQGDDVNARWIERYRGRLRHL